MQKMLDYVAEENMCRSSYLLEYFGQKEGLPCGHCDVCRSGKGEAAVHADPAAEIIAYVNEEMSGTYSVEDFTVRFNPASAAGVGYAAILRRLIDEGKVPPPVSD
jgi:ATP-dependent DNA helicase RecQ